MCNLSRSELTCKRWKKGVLCIPQSSPSDCFVSYAGHSLGGVVPLCRGAVNVFYSPSWQDKQWRNDTTFNSKILNKISLIFFNSTIVVVKLQHWDEIYDCIKIPLKQFHGQHIFEISNAKLTLLKSIFNCKIFGKINASVKLKYCDCKMSTISWNDM